jgi:hypothetical protein
LLTGFLEERNIVWGEVTGGLLMVGCSIALVIYLWQTQRGEIPLLPFLTFAGLTGLLFGLGLYSHRHWRLAATSRGLLVIATLFVPLDFLVLAGLSQAREFNPFESGVKLLSLALFALLTERAGRVVAPARSMSERPQFPLAPSRGEGRWEESAGTGSLKGPSPPAPRPVSGRGETIPSLAPRAGDSHAFPLALAVIVCSGVLLLIPRLTATGEAVGDGPLLLLGAGPVLAYGLGVGLELRRRRHAADAAGAVGGLLTMLGLAGFALVTVLGFLLFRAAEVDGVGPALERLAPLVPLAGAPVPAAGLFASRRLAGAADVPRLAALATMVVGAGVLVLLAALPLAWPRPGAVVAVGLIDFVILTAVAGRLRLPWAHAPALAALAVAGAAAGPWLAGTVPEGEPSAQLLRAVVSGANGAALAGLVAALLLAAEGWKRFARPADGRVYQAASGLVALASLTLVTLRAGTEPARAAWVAGAYTLGCWVMARRERLPLLAQAGSLTLLVTTLAALHALRPGDLPLLAVVLAAEALAFGVVAPAWRTAAVLAGLLAAVALAAFGAWPGSPVDSAAGLLLTAAAWVWAGRLRSAGLVWLGSGLLVLTLTQTQLLLPNAPERPLLTALLLYATLVMLADRLLRWQPETALRGPLWASAWVATLPAVPLFLGGVSHANLLPSAGYAVWLAGLWLAAALRSRRPDWFAASQVALTAAILLAVAAGLERQAAASGAAVDFFALASLRAFAAGLAGPTLFWALVRRWVATPLLEPGWPLPDRLLLGGLVVAQLALALGPVLLQVGWELHLASPSPDPATVFARTAGLTFALLFASVWAELERARTVTGRALAEIGLLTLILTVPVLIAAWFVWEQPCAATLACGLGVAGLVLAVPLRVGGSLIPAVEIRSLWRALLVAATAGGPVLLVVLAGAELLTREAGADTLIARAGLATSVLVPLALVTLSLTGHSVRERSAGFALAAGLVANLLVTGGFGLAAALAGAPNGWALGVGLLQRFVLTAAVWAVGWRLVAVERRGAEPAPAWWLQLGLPVVALAVLLLLAVAQLTLPVPDDWTGPFARAYPAATALTTTAGGRLGWFALAATVAAMTLPAVLRRGDPVPAVVLGGLGVLTLAACRLADVGPGWGYRTLLIGGAAGVVAWSVLAVWPRGGLANLGGWVAGLTAAVALLAAKAALAHGDAVLAAVTLALAGAAAGRLAQAWQREPAVFAAGLGFHLALSLLVIDRLRARPPDEWAVPLLQANAAVAAAVALDWLGPRDRARRPTVWLMLPVAVAVLLNAGLLARGLVELVRSPSDPAAVVGEVGAWGGGLALLMTLAALLLYARRVERAVRPFAWGSFGLAAGVWTACAAAPLVPGTWLGYHVLLGTWLLAGVIALVWERSAWRTWTHVFGGAVVFLAVWAASGDPRGPYATAGPVLLVTAGAVWLALRRRWGSHVAISGLLLAVAGVMVQVGWAVPTRWIWPAAAGLAAAALGWTGLDRPLSLPFRRAVVVVLLLQLLALAAAGFVGLVALSGVPSPERVEPLVWVTLALTAAAALAGLRDPGATWPLPSLYEAGLIGVALAWVAAGLAGPALARWAAVSLAGYVLVTAELAWADGRSRTGRTEPPPADPPPWFLPAEVAVGLVVVLLSLVVTLVPGRPMLRLPGPLAVGLLVGAGVFLVARRTDRWAVGLAYATLALGALGLTELGWALQAEGTPAPWLRRTVALVEALAAATVVSSFGLTRLRGSVWPAVGRSAGPAFGLLGAAVVVAAVLLEGRLFDPRTGHTPLGPFDVALVAAALAGLIAAALTFAVRPGADPFGLPERRRTLYVYGSEVLFLLLFLHTRFNVPALFPTVAAAGAADGQPGARVSALSQYWPFLVMLFAFAGVGLGELFRRRGLAVLSDPLLRTGVFLPLLPLVTYWLQPPAELREQWGEAFPGAVPLLRSLDSVRGSPDRHAAVWFLFSLLYAWLAVMRRSFGFSLAAALAANFGLWVLLARYDVAFLAHPQVWLIPLALIVLVSEAVNRDRLGAELAATLRYTGLGLLYLSSTADLFIAGLGRSAVLPVALAVLSVAGVLAGIALRVRAYVYLGVAFLGLVVVSMIWHAAVDRAQTWVWWVSGIILGAAILTLFALFEKHRRPVERAMEDFRTWR